MGKIKDLGRRFFVKPIVRTLIKLKIHPNVITAVSLIWAVVAFIFYRRGIFWAGAVFLFLCGIFDTFDGEIARQTKKVTKLGGFLDSTVDRINEFIVYLGLFCYYYNREPYVLFWVFLAMFGSMMVSYTRARGEGLGISPQVGIFERFIRFLLLIIGSVLGDQFMIYVLVILTFGTAQTMIQRIIFTRKQSLKN
ncbi:MAG TPA: CDP-alcohol phosphatidyltransferase family protein [candidate division WOR-3 bacterium]|uniref:CDP-alcohol phosphatidyltransferase family protein n=1 Tax=candidate division WOR-3 bacterium TaxID=2052148 RepID=A0A9C9EM19_UNCW3|nr:CDP-alcohol phosphatidyltransferase family protein [candidate division WOR-3 bacterium]